MDILMADGSIGEFGWELMSWQGYLRRKAVEFDEVIICTTAGLEPLYEDFADKFITHSVPLLRDCFEQRAIYDKNAWNVYRRRIDERLAKLRAAGHDVVFERAKKYIPITKQHFIKFGDAAVAEAAGDKFDIVVHARNKESNEKYYRVYNWPQSRWDELLKRLKADGVSVAAVGTTADARLPAGAVDLRGCALHRTMNVMAAAELVVGPSSGPMHLASLCGAPHLVWTGTKWSSTIQAYNNERYEWKWNPLHTPNKAIVKQNADVSVDEVYNGIIDMMEQLEHDPMDEPPGRSAAVKMADFWQKRTLREAAEGLVRRQDAKQFKIIDDKLRSALGSGQFDYGLDFGCGAGRFLSTIAERCDKVMAADLISVPPKNAPRNVTFKTIGFPTKLQLPDESVDLMVAVLTFQHIVDDNWFNDVARELRRVLADSAMVVIIDDAGKPSWHVKWRSAEEFQAALGFGWYEDKMLDLDSPESHHVLIGSHTKE